MKPIANLIHVNDIESSIAWYKRAFPCAVERDIEGFSVLDINGFWLEIVQADAKVTAGKSGSVTYWQVDDLQTEITRFTALGSVVYRGPMAIEDGQGMCQVTDPSGNLIGLRGPFKHHSDKAE